MLNMDSQVIFRRFCRGFSLIELIMVVLIIAVLIAIAMPLLGESRRRALASVCTVRCRQNGLEVTSYTLDWKDFPPVDVMPGDPRYHWNDNVFNTEMWVVYSERPKHSAQYRCPAYKSGRCGNPLEDLAVDYHLSASLFYDPVMYSKENEDTVIPPVSVYQRPMKLTDVLFSSQKALVYEHSIWHGVRQTFLPANVVPNGLDIHLTEARGSVIFVDGHAALLHPVYDHAKWIRMRSYAASGAFQSTPNGVRGADIP